MVPFFESLDQFAIEHILQLTNLETIFCSEKQLKKLLQCEDLYNLKNIVSFDPVDPATGELIKSRNLNLFKFSELIEFGSLADPLPYEDVVPEDILTFSITSGTTGYPKVAMISHKNLVSVLCISIDMGFSCDNSYLSYLPLSHIFERTIVLNGIYVGGKISFLSGSIKDIKTDLQLLK